MTARYRHRSSVAGGLLSREVTVDPITRAVYVGTSDGNVVEVTSTRRFSELATYTAGAQVVHDGITYTAKDDLTAGSFDPDEWNRLTSISPFDFGARANGTFDDTDALQAAVDAAADQAGDTAGEGYFVEVDLKGASFSLSEPIVANGSNYNGIILRNGKLTPLADSTWALDDDDRASGAMVIISGAAQRMALRQVHLACSFKTNGLLKSGTGNWTTVDGCYITQQEYWGVRCTGGGAFFVTNSRIIEHLDSMPSVGTRKARGIWLQFTDSKIFENIVNWCDVPLYLDYNEEEDKGGSTAMIANNHFFNGMPFTGTPTNDPTIIYIGERSSGCYFSDNYYDNGRIIVRCRRVAFSGGRFTKPKNGNTQTSFFTLQPNSWQTDFRKFQLSGPLDWPSKSNVKLILIDETEASFTGNKAALESYSMAPSISPWCQNIVRNALPISEEDDEYDDTDDLLPPFAVSCFASNATQSRAVFWDMNTSAGSRNSLPFFGSRGNNAAFGNGGTWPEWEVFPTGYLGGNAAYLGGTPESRIHLFGNGASMRITQEAMPVDSGASAPVLEHRMTGVGNNAGYRAYDKDFLVSGSPVLSHSIKASKPSASVSIPRTYSFTFALSATGEADAADVLALDKDALYPTTDNVTELGKPSFRYQQLHAGTTEIAVSDERHKDPITDIPDEVLDAWALVRIRMFKFKEAVLAKGDAARWHFGPIAQQVRDAFEAKGLNASMYAPFCYDHWGVQYDSEGNITADAGDIYSLRLQECLMIEAAYTRRELARIVDILNS